MNWSKISAVILGLAVCTASAFAQSNLADIAAKADLTEADRAAIKSQVDRFVPMINTGTPAEVRDAREALTKAFEADRVSVNFRVEAGRQLVDVLKPLIANPRDLTAVNALRVAGEVATSNSLSLVLEGLKDKRPPVRLGAAYALSRLLTQSARTAPAISGNDTSRALTALEAFIASETDARLIDTAITAMVAATRAPEGAMAADRMAAAISAKVAGKADATDSLTLAARATREMRDQLISRVGKAPAGTARAAAGVAAQLLTAIKAQLAVADKDLLHAAAGSAETTITIASTTLSGPDVAAMKLALADKAKAGNTEALGKELDRVNAMLKSEPFNLK